MATRSPFPRQRVVMSKADVATGVLGALSQEAEPLHKTCCAVMSNRPFVLQNAASIVEKAGASRWMERGGI